MKPADILKDKIILVVDDEPDVTDTVEEMTSTLLDSTS